jgi:dienelactone hydrolase
MMHRAVAAVVVLALCASATAAQRPQPPDQPMSADAFALFARFLDYDNTLPLNARTISRIDSATFVREKFAFDGWRGSRVPGLIALPKTSAARHPIVVLIDGIGGWKERWWQRESWNRGRLLIDSLLAANYGVVMIDAPLSGERSAENDFVSAETLLTKPAQLRDLTVQAAIEHRRLLDYLASRSDVDTTRVGVLGLSLGGMITFYLGAIEPRLKAGVAGLTPAQIPAMLWPGHVAGHERIPLLMLMGRSDGFYTQPQAQRIFDLIPTQKELVWYDVGHRLPEQYAGAAVAWYRRFLH